MEHINIKNIKDINVHQKTQLRECEGKSQNRRRYWQVM